jgi:hypothetical protein
MEKKIMALSHLQTVFRFAAGGLFRELVQCLRHYPDAAALRQIGISTQGLVVHLVQAEGNGMHDKPSWKGGAASSEMKDGVLPDERRCEMG